MARKLFPLMIFAIFLLTSCGSESRNDDLKKDWTLIDLAYSGTVTNDVEPSLNIDFDGQLVEGEASMIFSEEPNVINSVGMYRIQVESRSDDVVRVSQPEATFDQLGTWERDGNVITTSGDNSLTSVLTIASITDDKMELDFDYQFTTEVQGVPFNNTAKGTYFLATPEYIEGWKDQIKGGWVLDDVEYIKYDGTFSEIDGVADRISKGSYLNGTAPLEFGETDDFLSSGSYRLEINSTELFGLEMMNTSIIMYGFFGDGSYMINGKDLTLNLADGVVRSFNIVDVTEDDLVFFETGIGDTTGPFGVVYSRSRVKYTMSRKDYVPIMAAAIAGTWNLTDYYSEIQTDIVSSGITSTSNSTLETLSSDVQFDFQEEPNILNNTGSVTAKLSNDISGEISQVEVSFEMLSSNNWSIEDNILTVENIDPTAESTIFTIVSIDENQLVLSNDFDQTNITSTSEIRSSGSSTLTFMR